MSWLGNWRREKRSAPTTDMVVSQILANANLQNVDNKVSTWAEIAANLYERALAACSIEPDVLDPTELGMIARDCVLTGQSLWKIEVSIEDGLRFIPAEPNATVTGSYDRWTYLLTLPGPSDTLSEYVQAEAVLHFTWSTRSKEPWRGYSPVATKSLATLVEVALQNESSTPVGFLMPTSYIGGEETEQPKEAEITQIEAGLAGLKGKLHLIRSQRDIQAHTGAQTRDWTEPTRLGARYTQSQVDLYRRAFDYALDQLGIPSPLVQSGEGAGQREAWRRFVVCGVLPFGRRIEAELTRKLEREVKLNYDALKAFDFSNLARAVGSLVQSGTPLDEALKTVGLKDE